MKQSQQALNIIGVCKYEQYNRQQLRQPANIGGYVPVHHLQGQEIKSLFVGIQSARFRTSSAMTVARHDIHLQTHINKTKLLIGHKLQEKKRKHSQ